MNGSIWICDNGIIIQLFTHEELVVLPRGTTVYCINGKPYVKGRDPLDSDTRGGYTAYGQLMTADNICLGPASDHSFPLPVSAYNQYKQK